MKETSFVYHDKRGFFLHFGKKQGKVKQNRASEGSIGFYGALFFVFLTRKRSKTLVYAGVQGFADEAAKALAAGNLDYDPDARCDHHERHDGDCGHEHCAEHHCAGN